MTYQFSYTAVKSTGETVSGYLEAQNRSELLDRLLANNLYLLHARKKSYTKIFWLKRKYDRGVLERLATTMELLLGSRMELAESLEVLVATSDHQLAGIGKVLLERIRGGQTLSQASAAEPAVFGRQYPLLFALGEATGDMHAVFAEILSSVRWQRELKTRVKSLLTYPLLMLFVMVGVFLFLLLSVVPQLISFVESVNQQLPWHTHALFALSTAVQNSGLASGFFLSLIVGTLIIAQSNRSVRQLSERLLLVIPVFGPLLKKLKMARFFYCLAMLSRSHIDLLTALDTSKALLHSVVLEAAVSNVISNVSSGSSLADAMRDSLAFPELVWRMVRVGEKSGDLGYIFEHISELYDSEVTADINAIEQYLPPFLILLVGLVLMWMIVSVMGPLYDSVINAGVGLI